MTYQRKNQYRSLNRSSPTKKVADVFMERSLEDFPPVTLTLWAQRKGGFHPRLNQRDQPVPMSKVKMFKILWTKRLNMKHMKFLDIWYT